MDKTKEISQVLKALGHPDRLRLLCLLTEGERTVTQLVDSCGVSQSQISQFLARMRAEGLVTAKRVGQSVSYRIARPEVKKLIRQLKNIFCDGGRDR